MSQNNLEDFTKKLFNIIVNDENPDRLIDFLNGDGNEKLKLFASLSNDEIDRAILDCHTTYISQETSVPYEANSPHHMEILRGKIENKEFDSGKQQILHALYRIQYHYMDFQAICQVFNEHMELQITRRVKVLNEQIATETRKRIQEVQQEIFEKIKKSSEEITNETKLDIKTARQDILKSVREEIKKDGEKTTLKIQKVKLQAEQSIDNKARKLEFSLSKKASETSVTVLSIFSGIVLTIVAGLIYSASVLDNINSANFYRLMGAAALVGFVSFNLLVVMFLFVQKMRFPKHKPQKMWVTVLVNIVLLVSMLVFGVLQFIFPPGQDFASGNNSNTNISNDINLSFGETANNLDEVNSETDSWTEESATFATTTESPNKEEP